VLIVVARCLKWTVFNKDDLFGEGQARTQKAKLRRQNAEGKTQRAERRVVTFAQYGGLKWQRLPAAAAEALKPPPLFGHSNTA